MKQPLQNKPFKVYNLPVFVHFFGADGVGKTTQARMLLYYLKKKGINVKLVRIRSGRTLSSILYMFLKKINSNLIEVGEDGRVIRLKMIRNKIDRQLWSLLEFISMIPPILLGVFIPLALNKTVIAERYIFDAIATLAYLINDLKWTDSFLAKLLFKFIPKNTIFIHLDASYTSIQKRKNSHADPKEYIDFQRRTYSNFAKKMEAIVINTSNLSKEETHAIIRRYLLSLCDIEGCNKK